MIIIKALLLLLHFTLVPIAVGRLITYKARTSLKESMIITYIIGMFANYAIFFILNSCFVWYQNATVYETAVVGAFTGLTKTYSVIVAILVLLSIVLEIKRKTEYSAAIRSKIVDVKEGIQKDKFLIIYIATFVVLLAIQLYAAFAFEINEWSYDDFDYVVTSNDDVSYDMISNVNMITGKAPYTSEKRVAASWNTYIAYLAYTSGFEVTTVAHTILPVLLLLVAYMVYYLIADFLFKENDNKMIFMILLSVLFVFGIFSHYSLTFRLLCALWQGKAVLSAIAVPFLFIYLARILSENPEKQDALMLAALSLGASSLTTMSMLLISITVVMMYIVMSLYNKKICSITILLAGMVGPVCQLIFYIFVVLLLNRQMNPEVFGDFWFW
ncbi:MAG: hypothetical protein IKP29_04520 [Pseudobutyrivibrio sp.]|nr:hypothetical protein [Pseudobutyrivibrio sp.]